MVTVIFYEKPGCINNTKQKALLKTAGHDVQARNLLTENWTAETLRSFFGTLPVSGWFNRSAPAVKSGEISPEDLDAETAIALMIQNPLLIRRPLIQVDNQRSIGFDADTIDAWIGLQPLDSQKSTNETLKQQDLQTCPCNQEEATCTVPA